MIDKMVIGVITFAIVIVIIAQLGLTALTMLADESAQLEVCAELTLKYTNSTADDDVVVISKFDCSECFEFDTDGTYDTNCTQVDVSSDNSPSASVSALSSAINTNSTLVGAYSSGSEITLTARKCGVGGNLIYVQATGSVEVVE